MGETDVLAGVLVALADAEDDGRDDDDGGDDGACWAVALGSRAGVEEVEVPPGCWKPELAGVPVDDAAAGGEDWPVSPAVAEVGSGAASETGVVEVPTPGQPLWPADGPELAEVDGAELVAFVVAGASAG